MNKPPNGMIGKPDAPPRASEDVLQHAKEVAQTTVTQTKEQIGSQLKTQKSEATERLGHVADALRETGRHLSESEEESALSSYADRAADQIEKVSEYFRSRTIGDLVGDVERFARREPAIFLGGAFALGLMSARFLKSSAKSSAGSVQQGMGHRSPQSVTTQRPPGSAQMPSQTKTQPMFAQPSPQNAPTSQAPSGVPRPGSGSRGSGDGGSGTP